MALKIRTSLRTFTGALPFVILGVPALLGGLLTMVTAIGGLFGFIEGDRGSPIAGVIFGGVFAAVGALMLWSLYRAWRPATLRPEGPVLTAGTGPEGWAAFPKLRSFGRGSRGGVLLKPRVTRLMGVIALVFATIMWNGISWLAFWAVTFNSDDAPWFVKAMIWLFCGIGLLIFFGMVNSAINALRWGKTRVELQKELLRPGESTRMNVAQAGSHPIKMLRLTVVARESATYRVGTDSKTETYDIWTTVLLAKEGLTAQGDRPIAEAVLEIPQQAMHSFHSSSNRIEWFLRLEMEAKTVATVNEEYPFRVAPEVMR